MCIHSGIVTCLEHTNGKQGIIWTNQPIISHCNLTGPCHKNTHIKLSSIETVHEHMNNSFILNQTLGPSVSILSTQTGNGSLSHHLLPNPFNWRCQGLDLGPFACQADVLPLSHSPPPLETQFPIHCSIKVSTVYSGSRNFYITYYAQRLLTREAWDWTGAFLNAKLVLFHWSISPSQVTEWNCIISTQFLLVHSHTNWMHI